MSTYAIVKKEMQSTFRCILVRKLILLMKQASQLHPGESGRKTTLLFYMGRIEERARALAETIAGPMGLAVESVELAGSGRSRTLRVIIDKESGVGLSDCEAVSRELAAVLDVEDFIPGSYGLEVSSPGLDRPLKGPADFRRQIGKLVRAVTKTPFDGQTFLVGRLVEAGDSDFVLKLEGKKERLVRVPYAALTKARLEVEFK